MYVHVCIYTLCVYQYLCTVFTCDDVHTRWATTDHSALTVPVDSSSRMTVNWVNGFSWLSG